MVRGPAHGPRVDVVKESTTQVISPRLLALLDYLLHKLPYWSFGNYDKRVNEQIHTLFVAKCKETHRKALDDKLEGNELLPILFSHQQFTVFIYGAIAHTFSRE